jgi:hypothetical protein
MTYKIYTVFLLVSIAQRQSNKRTRNADAQMKKITY